MQTAPTINIANAGINGAAMTDSGDGLTWTYDWTVPAGNLTATITVAGNDLAGNGYAGSDNLTFTINNLSSNANLSNLTVSEGTISPSFDVNTLNYTASVNNTVDSIDITATLVDSNASISINSEAVTSGIAKTITLNIGENVIPIEVTAEDGTVKTYNLTITRAEPLSALIMPKSVSIGYNYTLVINEDELPFSTGNNPFGQLGHGETLDSTEFKKVEGLNNIVQFSAGLNHSLFLKDDGTVSAVGQNDKGQLGNNSTTDSQYLFKLQVYLILSK